MCACVCALVSPYICGADVCLHVGLFSVYCPLDYDYGSLNIPSVGTLLLLCCCRAAAIQT